MDLKPGMRLSSQVCTTQVAVVRGSGDAVDLTCGGIPLVESSEPPSGIIGGHVDLMGGSLLGKRYTDPDATIELLVTKAGEGSLGIGTVGLTLKEAKPLPSSD